MALPALYLAFAILVLSSMSALALNIGVRAIGTVNRGAALTQVGKSASAAALAAIRNQVAAAPAGTLPGSLTTPASVQTSAPGVGAYSASYTLQPYQTTSLGGSSTQLQRNVEVDFSNGTKLAPRYTLLTDIVAIAKDGSTDDLREVCTVRIYPQAPFADFTACTPITVTGTGSLVAADNTSDTITNNAVHSYDTCADASNSGGCTGQAPQDRMTMSQRTGYVSGAASSW